MTIEKEDYEDIKTRYPFLVERISYKSLNLEIAGWLLPLGEDMIIVSKTRHTPVQNFGPVTITYGFKNEADATAFKLRFGYEDRFHW